jgi:hypothetical protein
VSRSAADVAILRNFIILFYIIGQIKGGCNCRTDNVCMYVCLYVCMYTKGVDQNSSDPCTATSKIYCSFIEERKYTWQGDEKFLENLNKIPEGAKPFGRSRHRWKGKEINIEEKYVKACLEFIQLSNSPMVSFCNEMRCCRTDSD